MMSAPALTTPDATVPLHVNPTQVHVNPTQVDVNPTQSLPRTWMTSAPALATPDATVPIPASPTSLTDTLAAGLIMCRS